MRTKNSTPFPFGVKVTSTRPPQPEMTLVVRGRFDLAETGVLQKAAGEVDAIAQGPMSGDRFAEGDETWSGELVYSSDFADMKLRTDLLLRGACHTPGRRPMTTCPVTFQVGQWKKSLRVMGRRVWRETISGAEPGPPAPFVEMPLGYTRSFGGPGYEPNPDGLGVEGLELPNVEPPGEPILRRGDRPAPAGFGPVNPGWPQRKAMVGQNYRAAYSRERAPYYPDDFDWRFFNAAPLDQQLEGYLVGDEELRLQNLHPEHAAIAMKLPGLRIRCFVHDVEKSFREVRMNLDTLFVDGDAKQVLLTWRGLTRVKDAELEDVTTALVVAEPLAEPPLPAKHYQAILEKFEADPLEIDARVPKEEADLFRAARGRGDVSVGDALARLVERDNPGAAARAAEATPGFSLAAAANDAFARSAEDDAPPPVPIPGAPRFTIGRDLDQLGPVLEKLRAEAPDKAALLAPGLDAERLSAHDPNYRAPGSHPASTDSPGPGANLRGRDLTGVDLSGKDLGGADLEGAILTRAKLRGTRLSGANLTGALFFRADLEGAELEGANCTRMNAAKACFSGADLSRVNLEHAYLGEAELRGARLSGAKGTFVFFSNADLTEADLGGIDLLHSDFDSACLEGADLDRARIRRTLFWRARAARARLRRAVLDHSSFMEADLRGASFSGATGIRVNFSSALLDDADLGDSRFTASHFTKASAQRARFDRAFLDESRFFKAKLDAASFVEARLLSADLCKASVADARFTRANLFDAKLLDASGERCDFSGANLKRSRFQR